MARMIQLTIQDAARARGIKNAYQLALKAKCTPAKASRLWNGEKWPQRETLESLCVALECDLWELITWVPDRKKKRK